MEGRDTEIMMSCTPLLCRAQTSTRTHGRSGVPIAVPVAVSTHAIHNLRWITWVKRQHRHSKPMTRPFLVVSVVRQDSRVTIQHQLIARLKACCEANCRWLKHYYCSQLQALLSTKEYVKKTGSSFDRCPEANGEKKLLPWNEDEVLIWGCWHSMIFSTTRGSCPWIDCARRYIWFPVGCCWLIYCSWSSFRAGATLPTVDYIHGQAALG